MAHHKEIKLYFGQCRCCYNTAYLKDMWVPYSSNETDETYGKMLVDCFSISWTVKEKIEDDKICETCISKIEDAVDFKNMVLLMQEELQEKSKEVIKYEVDVNFEHLDESGDNEDKNNSDNEDKTKDDGDNEDKTKDNGDSEDKTIDDGDNEDITIDDGNDNKESLDDSNYDDIDDVEDKEYKDVQFLDEDLIEMEEDSPDAEDSQDSEPEAKKSKKSKKKGNTKWLKSYRQYTKQALEDAMEAFRSKKMNMKTAAERHNLPLRALSNALKGRRNETQYTKAMEDFVTEIGQILKHTNAIPFKSKANLFRCFFCPRDRPGFIDPQELREHTNSAHALKEEQVEFVMRPFNAYEMVRLDIEGLKCNCGENITWSEMFDHLKTHGVTLEESKKRVVPFKLSMKDMLCILCDFKSCYKTLDAHMNAHYDNYICGECGDTFITQVRYYTHSKVHKVGVFPCGICKKPFAREVYRKKHIEFVHEKKPLFRCVQCDERFVSDLARRAHIAQKHDDNVIELDDTVVKKLKQISCDTCNHTFTAIGFARHLKKCQQISVYECDMCDRKFKQQRLLDDHKLRHSGVKRFSCNICSKPFFSPSSVETHKKYQHNPFKSMPKSIELIRNFKKD